MLKHSHHFFTIKRKTISSHTYLHSSTELVCTVWWWLGRKRVMEISSAIRTFLIALPYFTWYPNGPLIILMNPINAKRVPLLHMIAFTQLRWPRKTTEESGSIPLSQCRLSDEEKKHGHLTTSCYQSSHQIKENTASLGYLASCGAL